MLVPAESITRGVGGAALALILAAGVAVAAVSWQPAPAYLGLFAPAVGTGAYAISVSASPLESVLRDVAGDQTLGGTPGGWAIRNEAGTDAFGTAGRYNRWQLARLYGSRQARVARGTRIEHGRVTEAWTLISPYPSPDLGRLEAGTLRIVLTIAP